MSDFTSALPLVGAEVDAPVGAVVVAPAVAPGVADVVAEVETVTVLVSVFVVPESDECPQAVMVSATVIAAAPVR